MARLRFPLRLLAALAAFAALGTFSRAVADGQAQVPLLGSDFVCEHPPYKVHIVTRSPLVVYIVDFLTPRERTHLRDITYVTTPHP